MVTGWITNTGKFIECENYGHFSVDNQIVKDVWEYYSDILSDIENDCANLIEHGEHPEWHRYEIAQDSLQRKAYNDLYKKGFLRVSTFGQDTAIEGFGQYIESRKYELKQLIDKHGGRLKIYRI